MEGDEFLVPVTEWPRHFFTAQRIHTIKDDKLDSRFLCCFHCEAHGGKVGIEAAPDVLHVKDECINLFQMLWARFAAILPSVEATNGESGPAIDSVFHLSVCRATDAVFWAEKRDQFH